MSNLIKNVARYYSDKLAQYGETPQGVDWNGEESQTIRFHQLCKVIIENEYFSINDLGCGYGAFLDFMDFRYSKFDYHGFDVSGPMLEAAKNRHASHANARFVLMAEPDQMADYSVASGVLNVRLQYDDSEWMSYIESTLDSLADYSKKGFSFNCLTSYSDEYKRREYLYYADPCWLFDLCKRKYSNNVALYHDYGLYEFTIVVRKHQNITSRG